VKEETETESKIFDSSSCELSKSSVDDALLVQILGINLKTV